MTKSLLFIFVFLSFFSISQQWTIKTPMPTARAASGAAVIDNTIYVIGGSDISGNLTTNESYNTLTDTWTTNAPMSVARGELAVAVVNGKLYAIGGYTSGGLATAIVEEYNPTTNTWTTKAPMTVARSLISCSVVNDKIYVVGGWPGNMTLLEEYNPATNTWTTKTACPTGRNQFNSGATINGKFHFIGGKNNIGTQWYDLNDVYDPSLNSWSSAAPLPVALFSGSATVLNNEIHYLGGTDVSYFPNFNTHYVYNSMTNSWSTSVPMLNNKSRAVSCTVGNKIYSIGGLDNSGVPIAINEEFDDCSNLITSITQTGVLLTADQTGATYQWLDCDNSYAVINGETNQSYTPAVTGNYAVEVNMNGCIDTSACLLVDYTGIEELIQSEKELVKIIDLMGRETEFKPNTPLIFIYSDGTRERVLELEK